MSGEAPPQLLATSRRGRPRKLAPGDQRDRALAAAREILREVGYGAMTMDAVARRAQLSKKTLYEIFASKAQLVAALVEAHRRSILALPYEGDAAPEQAIRHIFRLDAPEAGQHDGLIRLIMAESRAFPELRDILVSHGPRVAQTQLADWIEREVAHGRLATGDPRATAGALLDLMFGAVMPRPQPDDAPDRSRRIAAAIAIFLNGVLPRGR